MNKRLITTAIACSLLSTNIMADNLSIPPESRGTIATDSSGGSLQKIVEYLKNLGAHLGYDISKQPEANASQLLGLEEREGDLLNLVSSLLGATSVSTQNGKGGPFIPSGMKGYSAQINDLANATFENYNQPNQDKIAVNQAIDQQTFESDPVSQSIFNILTTPNVSFCMDDSGQWTSGQGAMQTVNSDCSYLYQGQVVNNVIGDYPKAVDFFSNAFNKPIIAQLNSNSLIAPLLYSYTTNQNSSQTNQSKSNAGLQANSQAEEALNFVRYAISDVMPIPLADRQKYTQLFIQATNAYKNTPLTKQKNAQSTLGNYLTSLRVYAAQRSVAASNLYSILSRRIPQASQSANTAPVSEALSDFTMAAWRLKDIKDQSGNTANPQWLKQINKASSATVQKEIAVLLAEINYQMYLSRQQQERLLLTNTMILMQNMKDHEPSLERIMEEGPKIPTPTNIQK